jgi:hypothetical protein
MLFGECAASARPQNLHVYTRACWHRCVDGLHERTNYTTCVRVIKDAHCNAGVFHDTHIHATHTCLHTHTCTTGASTKPESACAESHVQKMLMIFTCTHMQT